MPAACKRLFLLGTTLLLALGCGRTGPPPRWIVIGIDGAAPVALERLWSQGHLPNLKALSERGIFEVMQTGWRWSPQIWTTIATGVDPERHGITDFVVPTEHGDVPVTSELRRAPALWNMLTSTNRRVAVLGWWATWPAEEVNGVVVSDRPFHQGDDVDARVYPPSLTESILGLLPSEGSGEPTEAGTGFGFSALPWNGDIPRKDELLSRAAVELAQQDFDLLLVYVRSVDAMSHHFWRDFAKPRDLQLPPKREKNRQLVASAYEAADRLVGRLVEIAGADINILVISDHGFKVRRPAQKRVCIDTDRLLETLGFLATSKRGVDVDASRLYTFDSTVCAHRKRLRFGGRAAGSEVVVRNNLAAKLEHVLYGNGQPALALGEPSDRERSEGIDFVLEVDHKNATRELRFDGSDVSEVIVDLEVITGVHDTRTPGILLAAGPDIDSNGSASALHVRDVAPTLLYGLGLPVGGDFSGKAQRGLFVEGFAERHPLTTIATWGALEPGEVTPTDADAEALEQLRALGYLN